MTIKRTFYIFTFAILFYSCSVKENTSDFNSSYCSNSFGTVNYEINKVTYKGEYFYSYDARIFAIRLTSDSPDEISLYLKMDILQDSSLVVVSENGYRVMEYVDNNHRPFNVLIKVKNKRGKNICMESI